MKTELLILADRARMKVYTVDHAGGREPHPHLVDEFSVDEARGHFAEQFTDQAGSFPTGGTGGQGNSVAERMPLRAETEMRSFRQMAAHLTDTVRTRQPARWSFAAPSEINGAILDGVDAECRKGLVQNLPKDLVNHPADQLLAHFENA